MRAKKNEQKQKILGKREQFKKHSYKSWIHKQFKKHSYKLHL